MVELMKKRIFFPIALMTLVFYFSMSDRVQEEKRVEDERRMIERVTSIEHECYDYLSNIGHVDNYFHCLDKRIVDISGIRETYMVINGKVVLCMLFDASNMITGAYGYCLTKKEAVDLDSYFDD